MNNPKTIDRRDVAHSTNPIGGNEHIEDTSLAKPLDAGADKLPAGGSAAAPSGMPRAAHDDLPDTGTEDTMPPVRSGKGAEEAEPVAPDMNNPGRLDQVRAGGLKTAHVQSPRPTD